MLSLNFSRESEGRRRPSLMDAETTKPARPLHLGKSLKIKRSQSIRQPTTSRQHSMNAADSADRPPVQHPHSAPVMASEVLHAEMKTKQRAMLKGVPPQHTHNGEAGSSKNAHERKVEVHAYTDDPNVVWEMLKAYRPVNKVRPMPLDTPVRPDAVRVVAISDTHGRVLDASAVPPGDVLLVAGDFTTCGSPKELRAFDKFLGKLPHSYKLVIAGNHELSFDPHFTKSSGFGKHSELETLKRKLRDSLHTEGIADPRSLLRHCIYLEDSFVQLFGLTIYGTPWQPFFDGWAFNLPRGQEILEKWNLIPQGVDILLSHTPPLGHGDLTLQGVRAGCVELLNSVSTRIRPKYHVFGHIHDGAGCTTDGYTKFINACICDSNMNPSNPPVIFDIPLPQTGNNKKQWRMATASKSIDV